MARAEVALNRLPVAAKFAVGIGLVAVLAIAYVVVFYGDLSNSINTANNGHGMITVRILSRDGLDATALRPEAIKLTNGNGSGTSLARTGDGFHWDASADLNGDGRLDVTAGFRRDELIANGDLAPGANQLKLSGEVGSCGDVLGSALVYAKEKGR